MRYFFPSPTIRMATSFIRSNNVREAAFHSAEVPDSRSEEEPGNHDRNGHRIGVERGNFAQHTPAKSVDYSNQGVEEIERSPSLGNVCGHEGDRRNEQAELHHERNYVAKIAVLDIESPEQQPHSHRQAHREQGEKGQEGDLPSG